MIEKLIGQVPLFAALPDEELQAIAEALVLNEYAPGDVLFLEGELGDRFSIILEGEVEVVKAINTPDERLFAVLGPGEFIGEMSLLYRDRQRSASVRARTNARLADMTQANFDALLKRQPVMAFRIMQEMSMRLRNSEDATVRDLTEKNRQLAEAYRELQAAQAQIIAKERLEHELQVARRIQQGILPKGAPDLPGWKMAAHWQPARAVSGDFFDFIPFPDGRLGLVIGDATDKGVPAALVMATTRSVLRAVASEYTSPGAILKRTNNLLCPDMPDHMFVTCLFVVLDLATGHMVFANAGHNLPIQSNALDVCELRAAGMPLGLIPDQEYWENEADLHPGDCLLMYSDGLVEAHNEEGEMFDTPRLKDLLASHSGGPQAVSFLLEQLQDFYGPQLEQEDDVTLVAIEREK